MKPISINLEDGRDWVASLPPGDRAHNDLFLAATCYVAGAEAQLLRLFPHLAKEDKP